MLEETRDDEWCLLQTTPCCQLERSAILCVGLVSCHSGSHFRACGMKREGDANWRWHVHIGGIGKSFNHPNVAMLARRVKEGHPVLLLENGCGDW